MTDAGLLGTQLTESQQARQRVAVLVPCFNEEAAIARVIADFRAALPQATLYVYDNNSTDGTIDAARAAGAVVRRETHQGKGNVVRRMFSDIDADVYLLVDGDATYHAPSAPGMIARLLEERLDMVVAARVHADDAAYRPGHVTGNRLLTGFLENVFGAGFSDILSGYRVFSRRFVKSFPVLSGGFEIETELTVHALELELPVGNQHAVFCASGRIAIQAVDLARRLPHRRHDPQALSLGAPVAVLFQHRHLIGDHVVRLRHAGRHPLHRIWQRAAAADRDPRDGHDAGRSYGGRRRADPRHRDPRSPRGEAARLSGAARAGR
jgi:glycosyltransferase involved in cell wall biosynthesis